LLVALLSVALASPVVVSEQTWKGTRWVVAEVDLTEAHVQLVGQRPGSPELHTVGRSARWVAAQGRVPLFATNAGIYMEDRRPLGLHIEAGTRYRDTNRADGYGNFYLKPNGVFFIGPLGAAVIGTTEVPDTTPSWTLATQSGPMLVRGGVLHPKLNPTSKSRKTRSFVGVRDPQHIVLAVSLDRVRFHDTATFARDSLKCADALYLDGTVSEFWTPERPSVEGDPLGYGGVLVVSVSAEGSGARTPDRPDEHHLGGGDAVD